MSYIQGVYDDYKRQKWQKMAEASALVCLIYQGNTKRFSWTRFEVFVEDIELEFGVLDPVFEPGTRR